jgi:hypothetical protein
MANSVYQINKGINKSIEFRGLKGQYIWYLGGGIVSLLVLFSAMYIIGVNSFICIGVILIAGTVLVIKVYAMSNTYGEYGMMKAIAKRSVPKVVKNNSREVFKIKK